MSMRLFIDKKQEMGELSFDLEEVSRELKLPRKNLLSRLNYFKKQGYIVSPLRGYYIIIPLEDKTRGSLEPQEMVVLAMSKLQLPYYVGLLSAARYHGATHQALQVLQVIVQKRIKKPWIIGRVSIEFIYKKNVKESSAIDDKVIKNGILKVSTPEQTAKDIMIYHEKSGGLNRLATVFSELVEAINPQKLIKIARQDNKRAWLQRMAFILEQIATHSESKKEKLLNAIYNFLKHERCNFVPLAPELSIKGALKNKKWKIIKNTNIESDL